MSVFTQALRYSGTLSMDAYTESVERLIAALGKLPGIGRRTAERLAFYLLDADKEEVAALAAALGDIKTKVGRCSECGSMAEGERCAICASPRRDRTRLCVVEKPKDVIRLEATGGYNGLYHVLLGSLSPLDGIGPGDLKIDELLERVKKEKFKEIILATDFNTEGEATALYLIKVLKNSGAKLTRVAYGIPVGGDLQYADQATIVKAFEGRRETGK